MMGNIIIIKYIQHTNTDAGGDTTNNDTTGSIPRITVLILDPHDFDNTLLIWETWHLWIGSSDESEHRNKCGLKCGLKVFWYCKLDLARSHYHLVSYWNNSSNRLHLVSPRTSTICMVLSVHSLHTLHQLCYRPRRKMLKCTDNREELGVSSLTYCYV